MTPYPIFRAVAEQGVLVEFGETITPAAHRAVLHLDAMLAKTPCKGFAEATPAYVNLLVRFDPLITDHAGIETDLRALIALPPLPDTAKTTQVVQVCYDTDLAPDLTEVAARTGLSPDAVIAAHLAGDYTVYLYGFAPGYAYLGGVPAALHLPRKDTAVRGVAAGSVIIAGPQCIVTTMTMPTGWWRIGASPTQILRDDPARPFLFDVGCAVTFQRISRDAYQAAL
ncbi:MAG: 5-oxoprolinase subunit B family protein [Cypionkella sp.]